MAEIAELLAAGDLAAAAAAAAAAPSSREAIYALLADARWHEALAHAAPSVADDPAVAAEYALCLCRAGRGGDALALVGDEDCADDDPALRFARASALRCTGDWVGAEALLRSLLCAAPQPPLDPGSFEPCALLVRVRTELSQVLYEPERCMDEARELAAANEAYFAKHGAAAHPLLLPTIMALLAIDAHYYRRDAVTRWIERGQACLAAVRPEHIWWCTLNMATARHLCEVFCDVTRDTMDPAIAELREHYADSPLLPVALMELASIRFFFADLKSSAALMHEAVALAKPNTYERAVILFENAALEDTEGRAQLADDSFKESTAIWEQIFGPDAKSGKNARRLTILAQCAASAFRFVESTELLHQAHANLLAVYPSGGPHDALMRRMISQVTREVDGAKEALAMSAESLAIVERDLAWCHWEVFSSVIAHARSLLAMADFGAALAHARRAAEIAEANFPAEHPEQATAHYVLCEVLSSLGQYEDARHHIELCVQICIKALGPDNSQTLNAIACAAGVCDELGRFHESMDLLNTVLAAKIKQVGDESHSEVLSLRHQIGQVHHQLGHCKQALEIFKDVLPGLERDLGHNNLTIAVLHNDIGVCATVLGQSQRALEHFDLAEAIVNNYVGGDMDHPLVGGLMHSKADVYLGIGKLEEALELYTTAAELKKKALGPRHPNYASTLHEMAQVHLRLSHINEPFELLTEALGIYREAVGNEHASTAAILHTLGQVHRLAGRYNEARECLTEALRVKESAFGGNETSTSATLGELAGMEQDQGNFDKALELYNRALEALPEELVSEQSTLLVCISSLFQAKADYPRALEIAREALDAKVEVHGGTHPESVQAVQNIVSILREMGQGKESLELLTRVAERFDPDTKGNIELGDIFVELSRSFCNIGDQDQAILYAQRGVDQLAGASMIVDASLTEAYINQAGVLRIAQKYDQALTAANAAVEHAATCFKEQAPYASALLCKSICLSVSGKTDEAIELTTEVIRLYEALEMDVETAEAHAGLAIMYQDQGRMQLAFVHCEKGVQVMERMYGPTHPEVLRRKLSLAELHDALGFFADAKAMFEDTIPLLAEATGPRSSTLMYALLQFARCWVPRLDAGNPAECAIVAGMLERASEIMDLLGQGDSPDAGTCHVWLAETNMLLGKKSEALAAGLRALQVFRARPDPGSKFALIDPLRVVSRALVALGRHSDACEHMDRVVEIAKEDMAENNSNLWQVMMECADAHVGAKNYHVALRLLGDVEQMMRRVFGPENAVVQQVCREMRNIARIVVLEGGQQPVDNPDNRGGAEGDA